MGMRAYLREVQSGDMARLSKPEQVFDLLHPNDSSVLNLEKSWDGVHRLLASASPKVEVGFLFNGGTEIGPRLSYGRARLLSPEFVACLDTALKSISDEQFWSGFNAEKFESDNVYPDIWEEPAEELRDEYVYYLHELQTFIDRVAKSGGQVIVAII